GELGTRRDETHAAPVASRRAVGLDVHRRAWRDLAEVGLLDVGADPDGLVERQRVDGRAGGEDRARLANPRDDRSVRRRRQARVVELGLPLRRLRQRELELGLGRRDLLVAEAGACERERLLGRAQAGRRLVPAGLGQIKAALGRQSALIEAALALELLLGVAQRGPRLTDVRLGSLDLLRPAA